VLWLKGEKREGKGKKGEGDRKDMNPPVTDFHFKSF